MGYRNIFIQNNVSLTYKNNNLVVDNGSVNNIPIEDVNSVVLENLKSNVSTYLLSKISENNIALFICNEKHLPIGILLPFSSHSRKLKILKSQLIMKKPIIKKIWQDIVKQKIYNQYLVLKITNSENQKKLLSLVDGVKSGDSTNAEARAANIYFKSLFGKDFVRGSANNINSSLNYGYAIVRGLIARTVTAYGFEPSLGIFHCNQLNAFNLVDDLIEPFRAVVDLMIKTHCNFFSDGEFDTIKKQEIFNILNFNVKVNEQKQSLSYAVELMVKSLHSVYVNGEKNIVCPEILPLEIHGYE